MTETRIVTRVAYSPNGNGHHEPPPIPTDEFIAKVQAMHKVDKRLMKFSADDYGNADAIQLLHGANYRHCEAFGWMRYTGTHWEHDGAEQAFANAAAETLVIRRQTALDSANDAVLNAAKPSTRHIRDAISQLKDRLSVRASEFDSNPHVINCANGVVDLRAGTLSPHGAEQLFTYCIPTRYNPAATFPEFTDFLLASIKYGAPVVEWLQEFMGYCLTGLTRLEIMLYAYGESRAGKGTLFESILYAIRGIAHDVDFNTFTGRRDGDSNNFDLAGLKGARLVVADESKRHQELNTAKIKQITGGNSIRCCFKHKEHFEYRPQFKMVLISNFPVNADVDDNAMWYRVRVVEFPNSHAGAEDFGLKERFRSQDAQEAILAWMVAGAKRFYSHGNKGIPTPVEITQSTTEHREALDYVAQWKSECLEDVPGGFMTNEKLYPSYETWCRTNGVEPKKIKGLLLSLKAHGYKIAVVHRIGERTYKCVEGLNFQSQMTKQEL